MEMELLALIVDESGRDPRFIGDPFVDSPRYIITISLAYLVFIYGIGPRLMRDRKPLPVKPFIRIFNTYQILANVFVVCSMSYLAFYEVLECGLFFNMKFNQILRTEVQSSLVDYIVSSMLIFSVIFPRKKATIFLVIHTFECNSPPIKWGFVGEQKFTYHHDFFHEKKTVEILDYLRAA